MPTPAYITAELRKRLLAAAAAAVGKFNAGDWLSIGTQTSTLDLVRGHDRLLRSLRFGDDDYSGAAHEVMSDIVNRDTANLAVIEEYLRVSHGVGENVSTAPSRGRTIAFSPSVFEVPEGGVENDLIAVMMPFSGDMEPVFEAIVAASAATGFRCLRAKDIWEHSTVIQDVFSLIFKAHIVVCDFTGKNPNVFYEAGIAHTLGKHVVPITQFPADIPFDLQHHRYLRYLNNGEGRSALREGLAQRFRALHVGGPSAWLGASLNIDGGPF